MLNPNRALTKKVFASLSQKGGGVCMSCHPLAQRPKCTHDRDGGQAFHAQRVSKQLNTRMPRPGHRWCKNKVCSTCGRWQQVRR